MALRTISIDELDRLQLDEQNRLHWDGELVVTTAKLSLPWFVNWAIIATGAGTVGMFLIMLLDYWRGPAA